MSNVNCVQDRKRWPQHVPAMQTSTKVHGTMKLKCLNIYFVFIVPLHFIMIIATIIGGCLFSHVPQKTHHKTFLNVFFFFKVK